MKPAYEVKNVYLTNTAKDVKSRSELLNWVNETLQSDFGYISELSTGAAYCQLIEILFPGTVALNTVYFYTNLEHECFENYKILQGAFRKLKIHHEMEVDRLAQGQPADNLEFLKWFERFFAANYDGRPYDPIEGRFGRAIGYGPTQFRCKESYPSEPIPKRLKKHAKRTREFKRQRSLSCLDLQLPNPEHGLKYTHTFRVTAGSNSDTNLPGTLSSFMPLPRAFKPRNSKSSSVPVPMEQNMPCVPQFDVAFLKKFNVSYTPDVTREELKKSLDACMANAASERNAYYTALVQCEQLSNANLSGPHAALAEGMLAHVYEIADGFAYPTDD